MGRSQETWNKKEVRNKKEKKRKDKEKKKLERKDNPSASFDDMIAYVDENGMITNTPPDPLKKIVVKAEDIEVGVPKRAAASPEDNIRKGIVSFFNESKGYGFIKDINSQESIFVHVNGLVDPIKEDNKVIFEVEMGQKGLNAVNVKLDKS
jgi:cold shock CspA family protein